MRISFILEIPVRIFFFLCNSYSSQFLFFNQTLENSMWNRTKRMCGLFLESQQIKRSCLKSQFWCFLPFFQNCHFFCFCHFFAKKWPHCFHFGIFGTWFVTHNFHHLTKHSKTLRKIVPQKSLFILLKVNKLKKVA